MSFKQFKRTYPGNYSFNFSHCLSASNDFKVKNYTNFYLTNDYNISDVFDIDSDALKASYIYGPIKYGKKSLTYEAIDSSPYANSNRYQEHFNYYVCAFEDFSSNSKKFTFVLKDNNRCNIFFTKDYKKYYLCITESNQLVFVKESVLTFDDNATTPQDFEYLFSEDLNSTLIFKPLDSGNYAITKIKTSLSAVLVENDALSYITPFILSKNIYTYPNTSHDTTFITYNNNNRVNINKSLLSLTNNLLLHKKYSNDNPTDIIVLKNQLLQDDVFSSCNNLLSSINDDTLYVNSLREYTSISNDIKEETCDDLELNYVFYNKSYKIRPGTNVFLSPSSMYPFNSLNINDAKFISSGSFSYITPEYADKIYHLYNDTKNKDSGQYLLCTWLSGSPLSNDKIWVDRYYCPDLIEKEAALAGIPITNITYDDYIETLISNNSTLRTSATTQKFFDKLSDLSFTPNQTYIYERIESSTLPTLTPTFTFCNSFSNVYPLNYFHQINDSGEFSIGFNFSGDESSWILKSDRNLIDCGLTFEKNETDLTITYTLYDPSDETTSTHQTTTPINQLKNNFVCVGINSKTGKCYFYMNDSVILDFTIPIYQFYIKRLLYGDFYVYNNGEKISILSNTSIVVSDIFLNDYYIDPNLVFVFPLLSNKLKIDDIYITLPCGMRNSIDNMEYVSNICGSSSFKSNNINIKIKNLGISNESILNSIQQTITTTVDSIIPANVRINNVGFENFK